MVNVGPMLVKTKSGSNNATAKKPSEQIEVSEETKQRIAKLIKQHSERWEGSFPLKDLSGQYASGDYRIFPSAKVGNLKKWQKEFDKIDKTGDGYLSADEICDYRDKQCFKKDLKGMILILLSPVYGLWSRSKKAPEQKLERKITEEYRQFSREG